MTARQSFNFTSEIDRPGTRDVLEASRAVPEVLDLFETFQAASNDLKASAGTVYASRQPLPSAVATARAAARRVLAACDELDGVRE